MKKITALVLALVMTLSLLPMNVWAEGSATLQLAEGATPYNANYGIKVFTELSNNAELSYSGGMNRDNRGEVFSCANATSATVYLAIGEWNTATITDIAGANKTEIVGKWKETDSENVTRTYDIYMLAAEKGNNNEVKYIINLAWQENGVTPMTGSIDFLFDFTPVLTASGDNLGDFYLFTDLTNGELTFDRTVSAQGNEGGFDITVPCASDVPENVYLAVPEWYTLNMAGATKVGKWTTQAHWNKDSVEMVTYNIYSIAVTEPATGYEATKSGSYTYYDNEIQSDKTSQLNLIFDYMPVLNAGEDNYNADGVYVFTALNDGTLISDFDVISHQGYEGGIDITINCHSAAPEKLYLAVADWETFTMNGATKIGKWTTIADWDASQIVTYNIYSVSTLSKPTDGFAAVCSGKCSGEDRDGPYEMDVNLIFDYTPVLTGDTFIEFWGLKLFTDLDGSELSYHGGVQQWGDASGEYVTVYCAPEISKTIYLGVDVQNKVTFDGKELTGAIGKWSRTFYADWSDQYETETLNIYQLTVEKPVDSNTAEYTVVCSYDWYDDNGTPDDQTDDTSGTDSESFTFVFDFVNYPSDPLFVKDGEDYIDFADIRSGFVYDWELYYWQWDDATQTESYHPFGNSAFTLEASDVNGKDCSDKFSWNADGTLHFNGVSFTGDELPITLFIKDDTGYRHRLVIEDSYYYGQDRSCWKTYTTNVVTEGDYTYGGNSTFTVQLTPEQAQFIDLPDELTADNELVITVHDPGEAMWREMVNQAEEFEGISVFYQPNAKIGVKGGELPQVKYVGGPWTAEEFLELLYRDNYPIENYGTGGNGNIYGKIFRETDRTVIIPEASAIRSAWIWVYSDGTQLADSVNVKVVLADDVGGAVTLKNEPVYQGVDISRVAVQETGLEEVLDFEKNNGSLAYENGTLRYCYAGPTEIPELENAFVTTVADYVIRSEAQVQEEDHLGYNLLKVSAPAAGYTLKSLNGRTDQAGGPSVYIYYEWEGFAIVRTYTLVWVNGAGREYVEQITVETPSIEGAEPWMDHMYNGTIKKIDAERMLVTEFTEDCGAEYQLSDGLAYVRYDSDKELDVSAIKDAVISVQAPKNANGDLPVAYRGIWWDSGSQDDPTYNRFCDGIIEKLEGQVEAIDRLEPGENNETITTETNALLKQTIGDIEYYYSGDRGTRIIVVKWIFDSVNEDNGAVYEYLRLDTSPYYCTLKTDVSTGVGGAVDAPTAEVDQDAIGHSNIYLETRIHPQDKDYGQYFFELSLVDGEGNVFTEYYEDGYTIILPYSFMGEDWNYEMAKKLKEKPIINHYDKNYKQLAGNMGAIIGEYTARGIEFKVDSFSPFMLTWDETVKETAGGYTPSVTPDVSVNVDSGSLNEAALAVGSAINNGSADITPSAGYTKADIEKLQQESKLRMSIEKASDCSATDKETIDAAISKAAGTAAAPAAQYFDITVVLKHEDTGATVGKVRDTKTPISITVDLNSELQQAARAGKYLYVVRCHDGKTAFLKAELNTDKTKVTFSTSLFSAYAVVALDKEVPVEAASAAKPVTPPAQEPVAPAPEDTAPEVKPDAPVVDEPVVDEAPVVDTEPSGNAGLWIGVGIVALAAIVVVLVVMAARKKRKN